MKQQETALVQANNDAEAIIDISQPYRVSMTILGMSPGILFHRWNVESLDAKAGSKKGSQAKKEDDVESYVYRNAEGLICVPAEYVRQSIIHAAKFKQDPRSPRKSAMDLFKAAFFAPNELCSLGTKAWDGIDRRRVTVQRAGITRARPFFNAGWQVTVDFEVILPEYVSPTLFNETAQMAGRLVGIGDNRPSNGRFQVIEFKISDPLEDIYGSK